MIEKHLTLEDADPQIFYGPGGANMRLLKSLYPKLRIVARGDVLHVMGDEMEMSAFEKHLQGLILHTQTYNRLTEDDVVKISRGEKMSEGGSKGAILYSMSGRPIIPRSDNQRAVVTSFQHHDLTFVTGPAGSGKTYLSIALAVKAYKEKSCRRIILSRPAVEAGEKLGFLPGDMRDKIDPYLQPLYDALEDMIPAQKLREMMEQNIVQIAPLAFMRGRTLSDAVVILDEAQNTTTAQLRMFLTRMGHNCRMIVTGDTSQVDLPKGVRSGLVEALGILSSVEGIGFVRMGKQDIVRHKLVTKIVEAYESTDND